MCEGHHAFSRLRFFPRSPPSPTDDRGRRRRTSVKAGKEKTEATEEGERERERERERESVMFSGSKEGVGSIFFKVPTVCAGVD
jgi:hypothetical protein